MVIYLSLILSSFLFSIIEVFTSESKKLYFKLIQKLYILFVFVLFIFNRKNSDYSVYEQIFNGIVLVKEKGYLFLNYLIKKCGGTYNINLLILGILLIYVLFKVYKIKYKIFYIFLYSICTFIYDINQVRNLFSILFILIGLKFLEKKRDIFFIAFNIVAVYFQRLAYIYFLFYLLSKLNIKNYIKAVIVIFLGSLFLIIKVQEIMLLCFPDKIIYYLARKPNYGFLIYYILFFIDICLLWYVKKGLNNNAIYFKFILFPIVVLPTSYLFLEVIGRVWRNTLYIKWFYLFLPLKNKKIIIFFTLIAQQILLIGIEILKNPKYTLNLLSQIGNIEFYF